MLCFEKEQVGIFLSFFLQNKNNYIPNRQIVSNQKRGTVSKNLNVCILYTHHCQQTLL